MTDRSRVAVTLATALALGASTYGHAFDIGLPGVLQDIWGRGVLMVYGLAIVSVFLVNRWWALLPAVVPAAVTIYLHNMTDYVSPWREESLLSSSPTEQPALYIVTVIGWILLNAAALSVGLLLRAIYEWARSRRRGGSLPGPV